MRKFICIFLICWSAFCSAENIQPLYIVDGKIGVSPDELPLKEEIARTTVLGSEEAVDIYGERASGGVFIVTTKKYAAEQQAKQQKMSDAKQKKSRNSRSSGYARGIGALLAILLVFLAKPLKKFSSKIQKRIDKNRGATARIYDPGIFDSEGVRFSASERIGNYISVAFFLIWAAGLGWVLVKLAGSDTNKGVLFIFVFILFVCLLCYFVFLAVKACKILKCYLIVDEKGLRGVCAESFGHKQVLHGIDIRWEQVGKAMMMSPISIEFFKKGLKLPEHFEDYAELADVEGIEQGTCSVELTGLPVNKVKDAVNFFYARYQSQHPDEHSAAKMKSYLLPPQKDEEKLYHWIMVIFIILIGVLVGFLSAML